MNIFKQSGACQCGAVRYTLNRRPEVIYCCHCSECQKQSSSAFGISVRVVSDQLEISGSPKTYDRPSPNGIVACDFCGDCGTRVFHRRKSYAEKLNIKGGTFDDTSWIKPAGHIWTGSKQTWLCLPESDLQYKGQPDNYDALAARYMQEK